MDRREKIGIRSLKNDASRIVNEVRERGVEYLVTKRGEPVAVLRPLTDADSETAHTARADEMIAKMRATARRICKLSSGESAASVVSRQRR